MPTTTYSVEPDTMHDPTGRLADFSRFAVGEFDELYVQRLDHPQSQRLKRLVGTAQGAMVDVANILDGFTTADES